MNEVIKITASEVTIGKDDGSIEEVRPCDLNFIPQVGDKVKVFKSEGQVIVTKIEPENNGSDIIKNGGVNINVSNTNSNSTGSDYAYAVNKKVVNKVAYCLIAFFLGGIGIHKFYAGKIGTGILFILFCWTFIPSIIAFIEFIVALCRHSDANGNILV